MGCVTIDPVGVSLDTAFAGAVTLLGCLEDQLELTVGGPVCRACLYPGAVPMDICTADSECASGGHGMAAVRVSSVQLVTDQIVKRCTFVAAQIAVTYEMSVFRCAHTILKDMRLPSCDDLASDTAVILDDAAAMRSALKCCYGVPPEAGGCAPNITGVGPWAPRGPTGGCVGGSMSFTVNINDCACGET